MDWLLIACTCYLRRALVRNPGALALVRNPTVVLVRNPTLALFHNPILALVDNPTLAHSPRPEPESTSL